MSEDGVQRFQEQAKSRERKYDWLGAIEFHRKALTEVLKRKDSLKAGEAQERIGYCLHKAAFQAESKEEFRERMGRAIEAYEKTRRSCEKLADKQRTARMFRCDAMIAYLRYWLLSDASEKKRSLDESWNLTKKVLNAFEKAGNMPEYGKTYNLLSSTAFFDYALTWDFQAREKTITESMEYGERTILLFSGLDDPYELARAYVKTALHLNVIGFYFTPDLEESERHFKKGLEYWQKAIELSEEAAFLELLSFSGENLEGSWGRDKMLVQGEKALGYAKRTKDKYLIGAALDSLVYAASVKLYGVEDPDKGLELLQKTLQYAEDAKQQFSSISFISPRGGTFGTNTANAEYYLRLAVWETNLRKKQDLLKKSLTDGTRALKQAESTGCPDIIRVAHLILGNALGGLARIEMNSEEKRKLLEKALEHRKEYMNIASHLLRFFYWNLGLGWTVLAISQGELSTLETNSEKRKNMLTEAVSFMERGLQLLNKHISFITKKGGPVFFKQLGVDQYHYGVLLNRLYELTNNNEHQRRAIRAFKEAAQLYQKVNIESLMAECNWKAAISFDRLSEHLKATEYFDMASTNYKSVAEKIPQLKEFYQDHAQYMRTWSEIEKGKHYHARQEYGCAKGHYEKAAMLYQSLERWSYLAPNYFAWAQVENAEDLSRKEQSEEALEAFAEAAKLFTKTKKSLETKLGEIENLEEKIMATTLIEASDVRRTYCIGRMALEEAKIFSKKGDYHSSSERYGSAAQTFEKVLQELESEQDRKEFNVIINLSRAWQKMMMAEEKASSTLYSEAAELFNQAKEYTLNQPSSLLALANSSFCKALEAGTKFETTRDTTFFSAAKKHMEAAANYYLKAGLERDSTWVNANQALLDAYIYTSAAETALVHEEKIQQYQLAEKYLERSAELYEKTGYMSKKDEVLKILGKVREKREFALSLSEAFKPPTAASSTATFSVPASTKEEAVGLDRFEQANIQALLSMLEEATVGEEFEVHIDLANIAKEPGLLVRIDELVPPAFEVAREPTPYFVEGRSLNTRGKQLAPQKVESITIALRATRTGNYRLNPVVIYVDDLGKFKTCKPEPVNIIIQPKLAFEFKTKAAQTVFEYLTRSFVEDYMKRRISLEKSGWRTLMQIIKHGKVSKTSVYGAGGRRGHAVSELQRRGLVETRIFPGERGRGGKITKMRISYDKDTVKRHLDQSVMKIKEK